MVVSSSCPPPPLLPGLSFEPGLKVQSHVWAALQRPVSWPDAGRDSFVLVVSFGRCKFKLCPASVELILQATIGGSASHFKVSCLHDRTFKFIVASKPVGFFIHNLRSFSCDRYSLFFHLWNNGGPNWRLEFKRFQEEERISWTTVRSSSTPKSFADSVLAPPLSGANLEPLGRPRISKQLWDRLSFPPLADGPARESGVCPRCLLTGHPRVNCGQPIRCRACLGWGHVAAFCLASRPIGSRPYPDGRRAAVAIFCFHCKAQGCRPHLLAPV